MYILEPEEVIHLKYPWLNKKEFASDASVSSVFLLRNLRNIVELLDKVVNSLCANIDKLPPYVPTQLS